MPSDHEDTGAPDRPADGHGWFIDSEDVVIDPPSGLGQSIEHPQLPYFAKRTDRMANSQLLSRIYGRSANESD